MDRGRSGIETKRLPESDRTTTLMQFDLMNFFCRYPFPLSLSRNFIRSQKVDLASLIFLSLSKKLLELMENSIWNPTFFVNLASDRFNQSGISIINWGRCVHVPVANAQLTVVIMRLIIYPKWSLWENFIQNCALWGFITYTKMSVSAGFPWIN